MRKCCKNWNAEIDGDGDMSNPNSSAFADREVNTGRGVFADGSTQAARRCRVRKRV